MSSKQFDLTPLGDAVGAAVAGIDVAEIGASRDAAAVDALKRALGDHLMLRISGQTLSPGAYVAFARLFGPMQIRRREDNLGAEHIPDHPEIKVITNARTEDDRKAGDGSAAELMWHTDGSRQEQPQIYSFLYGRVVPAKPPRTFWLSMIAAYEALPAALKSEIAGRHAIHSVHNRSSEPQDVLGGGAALADRLVGPKHPLVRRHPDTRRSALYLPTRRDAIVDGLSPEASADLIGRLWDHVDGLDCIWGGALQPDDLVIWDNRTTVHRREAFDDSDRRIVHYLAAGAEPPIAA